jgi:uncharacterized protein YndB with AHSA1/START domain
MADATMEPKVIHATCVVERSFSKPAEVVFAALSEPAKIQQWMSGGHSELIGFQCEFKEGGQQIIQYRMLPGTPIAGAIITNAGRFQQIVPFERILTVSTMKMGDHLFSASQVTFELLPSRKGTDLVITHQGAFFEGSDGPERREEGWNTLADNLAALLQHQ